MRNNALLSTTMRGIVLMVLALACATASAQVSRYVSGQDYKVVAASAAQPGEPVRVVEFFLYSCPHCFALASQVADWRQTLADDVEFRYVPVLFGGSSEAYARMFYTAKALDVLDQ